MSNGSLRLRAADRLRTDPSWSARLHRDLHRAVAELLDAWCCWSGDPEETDDIEAATIAVAEAALGESA